MKSSVCQCDIPAFLLGTGPSLSSFDWSTIPDDAHVCAVNGAGIVAPRINSMVFCDKVLRLVREYGEPMKDMLKTPRVLRVTPDNKESCVPDWVEGVAYVARQGGQSADKDALRRGRHAFDGRLPLFWLDGLSCTFALLWLVHQGFRRIVFVGHDMMPGNAAHHFYGDPAGHRLSVALERQFATIRGLWPLAGQRGITLLASAPSRLLEFMPAWEPTNARQHSSAI